jgi:RNA polymerase sigma-70 factor, ECF subfamily
VDDAADGYWFSRQQLPRNCAAVRTATWRVSGLGVVYSEVPGAAAPLPSDEDLMRLYQKGDERAFRRLYERHRAPLWRFVRRTAPAGADSEEIVQETWLAVVYGRDKYRPDARFATYLFSIAHRRGIERWRRQGRQPEFAPQEVLDQLEGPEWVKPDNIATSEVLGAAISRAVQALPLAQRETFLLRAETNLSLDEIAEVTGTGRETAKSRLRYALQRLRAELEPWT